MRTARSGGSFAQDSGDFVLMFVSGLLSLPADECQPDEIVGGTPAKAKHIAVQPIPQAVAPPGNEARSQFHRQWPMPGACDVLPQLLLVRREDADAVPSA